MDGIGRENGQISAFLAVRLGKAIFFPIKRICGRYNASIPGADMSEMLPLLVVYLFANRTFMQVTAGSVKG